MLNTSDFKAKAEIMERRMPRINGNNQHKGKTIVALDCGYSALKGVSPNRVFKIPSYAKKAPKDFEIVAKIKPTDIQLRNNATGEIWLVGESAEILMNQADIDSTTDASLYTRYRYDSDIFKVLMSTGLALGLLGTGAGNDIYVQTGLPATYMGDKNKLTNALIGAYDISIKLGNNDWVTFKFYLDEEHIDVIMQPQGTLCATAYENGEVSEKGKEILSSSSIILDMGFGTEDIFVAKGGYKIAPKTYSDTGMRAVFEAVIDELSAKNEGADFKIFEFQNYLEKGEAPCFDPSQFKINYIQFADILERKNHELCEKSIKRLIQEYDSLIGYQYLIVTGGTGESRFEQINQMLEGFRIQVLPGNINCPDLSFSYSNVIGYYMLRHARLSAEIRRTEK